MTKLSDTQAVILSTAAQHEMGLARAPKNLPAAARNAVFRSLIKNNLLTEINAPREHVGLGWRQDDDGTWIVARITDEGLRAIGIDPNEDDAVAGEPDCSGIEGSVPDTAPTGGDDAQDAPQDAPAAEAAHAAPYAEEVAMLDEALANATPRTSLRDAAAAFLAAWDASLAQDATDNPISRGVEALRAALAKQAAPRAARENTKREQVLAMLARTNGATAQEIADATGWSNNTVRGFLAGLKAKGHTITSHKAGIGAPTSYRVGG
jgi:DNA-binding CsgD family transcriptional regulator